MDSKEMDNRLLKAGNALGKKILKKREIESEIALRNFMAWRKKYPDGKIFINVLPPPSPTSHPSEDS